MPRRLFVDEITSVGGVDAGDNPAATVVFWKRRDPTQDSTGIPVEKDSAASATVTTGRIDMTFDTSRIADESLRSELDTYLSDLTARAKAAEASTPADQPDDDVTKNLSEEAKAEIAKRDTEVADLRKRLDAEVAHRRASEFIEKARPFASLLGKATDVGPILDAIEAAAPEAYAKLMGPLTAAVQRTELATLFKEIGTAGDGESDPLSKRDAWVAEFRKNNPDATVEQARAAFWAEHPAEKAASREEG